MAKILVIDPSHRNRTQVERILRLRSQHQVLMAEDGAQAFEVLGRGLPDVILMDLFLPRVDGFHVYRVLKEGARTAGIPIILSTSVALDPVTEARIRQLRIEGRVEMPVSSAELLEVVSLVLIRHQAAETLRRGTPDPQKVAAVQWPRIARPTSRPEPPSAAQEKVVKPVVWPSGSLRKDGDRGEPDGAKPFETVPQADQPLTGREHRARLAMLATGQVPPPQKARVAKATTRKEGANLGQEDHEAEGTSGPDRSPKPIEGDRSRFKERPNPAERPGRGADPTYSERLEALLTHLGKPDLAPPGDPPPFRGLGAEQVSQGRLVDFTRKTKEGDVAKGGGDSASGADTEEKAGRSRPEEGSRGPSEGQPGDPVIRPVHWTQIKKDT